MNAAIISSTVLDRELEEDKKLGASEPPRIRCPLCGWSPRKEDHWFCESPACANRIASTYFLDSNLRIRNNAACMQVAKGMRS